MKLFLTYWGKQPSNWLCQICEGELVCRRKATQRRQQLRSCRHQENLFVEMIINWRRKQTILTNFINALSCLAALRSLQHAFANSSLRAGRAGGEQSQSSTLELLFRVCKSGDYSICWRRLPGGNNTEDKTVVWLRHMKHFPITTWCERELVSMHAESKPHWPTGSLWFWWRTLLLLPSMLAMLMVLPSVQ